MCVKQEEGQLRVREILRLGERLMVHAVQCTRSNLLLLLLHDYLAIHRLQSLSKLNLDIVIVVISLEPYSGNSSRKSRIKFDCGWRTPRRRKLIWLRPDSDTDELLPDMLIL